MTTQERIVNTRDLMVNFLRNKAFEVHIAPTSEVNLGDFYAMFGDGLILFTAKEDGCYSAVATDFTRPQALDYIEDHKGKMGIGGAAFQDVMNKKLDCSTKIDICNNDHDFKEISDAVNKYIRNKELDLGIEENEIVTSDEFDR